MIRMLFAAITLLSLNPCSKVVTNPDPMKSSNTSFYDFKLRTLDGEELSFDQFKGKNVLLVNTASECGFTPQYKDLQKLHELHGDQVTVVGFPCNDFGGQEPGSSDEIKSFCSKNYGVTFQMMEKVAVKGKEISPLYKWLTDPALNGWNSEAPSWNFCKYLVNKEGKLIKYFNSSVKPLSDEVLQAIK